MHKIKTKSSRKYHIYSLLKEIPPLTEQTLSVNPRQFNKSSRRLLQTAKQMSLRHQYLYIDMQEGMHQHKSDSNMIKLLEKQPGMESSQSDDDAEKYGNKCIRQLYNLSPGNKKMLSFMTATKKQTAKKESLRAAIKKRLNELANPEIDIKLDDGFLNKHDQQPSQGFLLLPTNQHGHLDTTLNQKQLQLIKKFGIVSDYCFQKDKINQHNANKKPGRLRHFRKMQTINPTEAMRKTLQPFASLKLPTVRQPLRTIKMGVRKMKSAMN